jgi:hypothetical protein
VRKRLGAKKPVAGICRHDQGNTNCAGPSSLQFGATSACLPGDRRVRTLRESVCGTPIFAGPLSVRRIYFQCMTRLSVCCKKLPSLFFRLSVSRAASRPNHERVFARALGFMGHDIISRPLGGSFAAHPQHTHQTQNAARTVRRKLLAAGLQSIIIK